MAGGQQTITELFAKRKAQLAEEAQSSKKPRLVHSPVISEEDESNDYKLTLLHSLYLDLDVNTLLDILLANKGSVELTKEVLGACSPVYNEIEMDEEDSELLEQGELLRGDHKLGDEEDVPLDEVTVAKLAMVEDTQTVQTAIEDAEAEVKPPVSDSDLMKALETALGPK